MNNYGYLVLCRDGNQMAWQKLKPEVGLCTYAQAKALVWEEIAGIEDSEYQSIKQFAIQGGRVVMKMVPNTEFVPNNDDYQIIDIFEHPECRL